MERFHVVRIHSKGYARMASYTERHEARNAVLADTLRVGPIVLRDGRTGARFSWAELNDEKGGGS